MGERKYKRERRQVNEGEGRKRFMAARINFFFERSRRARIYRAFSARTTVNRTLRRYTACKKVEPRLKFNVVAAK